jgi:hypothetical protein
MFSLLSWYNYNFNHAFIINKQVNKIMNLYNVATCLQTYIRNFIICPSCNVMYDNDGECYCWFIKVYYATIIIIPEEPDDDNDLQLIIV